MAGAMHAKTAQLIEYNGMIYSAFSLFIKIGVYWELARFLAINKKIYIFDQK